jgi:hypothetical protein
MKRIALALALVLTSSSLVVGLASDANAGARKFCKQGLKTHYPMAGKQRDLMKQCKAEYKAHKKAGHARRAT